MNSMGKILGSLGMTRSAVRFVSALGMTAAVIAGVTLPTVVAEAAATRPIHAAVLPRTGASSAYTAQAPNRILDTRSTGQRLTGGTLNLTVAGGTTTVPAGAGAVVLNVTVTGTVGAGFLTVWPAGNVMPTVSNLNWAAGDVRPNLVTVQVGTGGQVSLFANSPTDVVVDEEGYYGTPSGTAGGYVAVTPARITDTRAGSGFANAGSTLGAGSTLSVQVTGAGTVPATGVSGVVLNATVTGTTGSSFLTAWPAGGTMPTVSNLNWVPGWVVPNRIEVPVGTGGKVNFYNKFGSTDLVVDVDGYYTDATASGQLFTPQNPARVIDTRVQGGTLGQGATGTYQVSGFAGVPAGATAVLFNVTVTNTTAPSYLTVFPGGASRPTASDLNWVAGQTIPNMDVATLSASGSVSFYNNTGSTDVIADLSGFFGVGQGVSGVTVTASPSTVSADGSTNSTVTVTVLKANGSPAVGDPVLVTRSAGVSGSCGTFTGGTSSASGSTNASGQFTTTYTSSTTAGTCTINATEAFNGGTGSTTITQTASNTVVVGLNPQNIKADGSSTSTVTATVTNAAGTAVSGDSVTFTTAASPAGACGSLGTTSGTTGTSGQVSSTYTASTTSGFCTITATESSTSSSASKSIDQTLNTGTLPANTVSIVASPTTVKADGTSTSTVTVTVLQPGGAVLPGDPVLISKSESTSGSCGTLSSKSGVSNSSGQVTVTYTASSTAGTCTLNAKEANGANSTTTAAVITQTAFAVTETASPSTVNATPPGNTSAITVTVKDSSGTAVASDTVTFLLTGNPAAACGTLVVTGGGTATGNGGSATGTTNSSGQVTGTYTAAAAGGNGFCTIKATESNGGSASVNVLQRVPSNTPTSISVSASPSSIKAATGKTSLVTATVKNAQGTGVMGDTVLFSTSGSPSAACGSLTDPLAPTTPKTSGTTDASGQVQVQYNATTTVGTCTVTAQEATAGLSNSTNITQTVAGNSVSETFNGTCVATTGANTPGACIKADGSSTVKATAAVKNPSGNPVSADVVTFSVTSNTSGVCSSGSLSASTATTDTNGNASVTYTASTASGYCTITATEANTSGSDAESIDQTNNSATLPANAVVVAVPQTTLTTALTASTATTSLSVAALPAAIASGTTLQLRSSTHSQSGIVTSAAAAKGALAITVVSFAPNFSYPVGASVLQVTGNTVAADGSATATLSITVSDSTSTTGAAVSGDPVMLSTSGTPSAACGTDSADFGTTDVNGTMTVTYTASTTAGPCVVTAQEANGAHNGSATITQAASNSVSVSANPTSMKADGSSTSTITVKVTDSTGAAVSGDTIGFSQLGTPSSSACGGLSAISGSPSGTTDSTGTVTATYTASTTIGFCKITAQDSTGASGSVQIIQTS